MVTLEQVIEEAVAAHDGNQAALARAIERSASVVGNWRNGRYTPDFESCLAIAEITNRSPVEVLRIAKFDPRRLLAACERAQADPPIEPEPIEREVRARTEQMWEAVQGAPQRFWLSIISATLGRSVDTARAMAELVIEAEDTTSPTTHNKRVAATRITRPGPPDPQIQAYQLSVAAGALLTA